MRTRKGAAKWRVGEPGDQSMPSGFCLRAPHVAPALNHSEVAFVPPQPLPHILTLQHPSRSHECSYSGPICLFFQVQPQNCRLTIHS